MAESYVAGGATTGGSILLATQAFAFIDPILAHYGLAMSQGQENAAIGIFASALGLIAHYVMTPPGTTTTTPAQAMAAAAADVASTLGAAAALPVPPVTKVAPLFVQAPAPTPPQTSAMVGQAPLAGGTAPVTS